MKSSLLLNEIGAIQPSIDNSITSRRLPSSTHLSSSRQISDDDDSAPNSIIKRIRSSVKSTLPNVVGKQKGTKRTRLAIIFTLYILIFVITFYTSKDELYFTIVGGWIGFVSSLFVLIIFHIYPESLVPPLELMYWRCYCDLLLGLRFMLGFNFRFKSSENPLSFSSGLLEFAEIASELWTFCVVIDLLHSISHPFSNFKNRMKYYHLLVWSIAFIFGMIVLLFGRATTDIYNTTCTTSSPNIHDLFILSNDDINTNNGFCWVTSNTNSPYPWIFLYLPIMLIFTISIIAIYISYRRLRNGVALSLIHRINILILNFLNIACNLGYWIVLGLFSLATASIGSNNASVSVMISILLFLIAGKGVVNVIIWVFVNDVNSVLSSDNNTTFNDAMRDDILVYLTTGIKYTCKITNLNPVNDRKIRKVLYGSQDENLLLTNNIFFLLNILIGNEEIINQVIARAKEAQLLKDYDADAMQPFVSDIDYDDIEKRSMSGLIRISAGPKSFAQRSGTNSTKDEHKAEKEDSIMKKIAGWNFFGDFDFCVFTEYEPYYFQQVRKSLNVTPDDYISSFRVSPRKARLTSGGASGALFFVTHDEKYIGKSLNSYEKEKLIRSAPEFCEYLAKNKNTYITKVLGLYSLKIFGCEIILYIMINLSPDFVAISEKYDIKGSFIKRNSTPPREGQVAVCLHCQSNFIYRKRLNPKNLANENKCKYTISGHDPIILMKDNDLKSKFYIGKKVSRMLFQQLKKDAIFLNTKMNVMDYSLLICVKRCDVNPNESLSTLPESQTDDGIRSFQITKVNVPAEMRFGIVDFLQEWNFSKRVEQIYKIYFKRQDPDGISAVEPARYCSRFVEKCSEIFDVIENEVVEI